MWNNNYIEYESNGDKFRYLSLDEYLNKIEPYFRNMIIEIRNSDTSKIQLKIAINFISSKVVEEERVMRSSRNNIKFTSYNDANEVVDELFESLRWRYQGNLETLMRGSDFIFDSVQPIYYKCGKGGFWHGASYIDSADWVKKKATINPKNEDKRYFQYLATVPFNHDEIKRDPQWISKINLFINKYN